MKIDGIIEDLGYHILNSKDENFLSDIMYAASLSDDELDDEFYHYLNKFINCYLFYVTNPGIDLKVYDELIFRRFFLISLYRFKRGLVSFPDTIEDEL